MCSMRRFGKPQMNLTRRCKIASVMSWKTSWGTSNTTPNWRLERRRGVVLGRGRLRSLLWSGCCCPVARWSLTHNIMPSGRGGGVLGSQNLHHARISARARHHGVARSGDITDPCPVPFSLTVTTPSSRMPALSHFWIKWRMRGSAIRCSTNLISQDWLTSSKKLWTSLLEANDAPLREILIPKSLEC
jgi:hypothetical protein